MRNKKELLEQADKLVKNMDRGSSSLIKHAIHYLRRKKDISDFKNFLKSIHYSDVNKRNWERFKQQIKPLLDQYSHHKELHYILGWAHRLRKYYYSD